jgi:recombination protein RecA
MLCVDRYRRAFDPVLAVEAGVDLDRVLWVNCGGNAQHALKSTDLLIQAGGFGLVVLDMADTADAITRRIPLASWFRLRHAAERTGAALVAVERQIKRAVLFRIADRDAA